MVVAQCFTNISISEHGSFLIPSKQSLFNSFLASSDFCNLLITFANSLDPDQDRQNVSVFCQS